MSEAQTSGVITIGETEYAVGMFWQTAEDPKTVKREAKVAAKQEVVPADLFVMREGFVVQWAIGWSSQGHKRGMPAAAACLANVVAGNWLGVFEVDGGWWFVASRRDAVLPDGDILYDNEDEPRTRFETEFVRGGWDRVFTPEHWGMGADATSLEEVMAGQDEPQLDYLLDFYSRLPKSVKVAAVAALAGVAVVGYIGVQVYNGLRAEDLAEQERLAAQQQAALQARMQAEAAQRAREEALRNLDIVLRLWEDEPRPQEWIGACASALDDLSVEVPGWRMQTLSCAGSAASVVWSREAFGSLSSARYGLEGVATPSIDASGNNLSASRSLTGLSARGDEVAWKIPVIRENFLELFQGLRSDVQLTIVERPPIVEDDTVTMPRPRPPRHFQFSFFSELSPMVWSSILSEFPGLIVDQVVFRVGGTSWEYSGRVYEELADESSTLEAVLTEGSSS